MIQCEYCRGATKLATHCENCSAPPPAGVLKMMTTPPIIYNPAYIKPGTFSNKPRELIPIQASVDALLSDMMHYSGAVTLLTGQ